MSALDELFLEVERHAILRSHATLTQKARAELARLRQDRADLLEAVIEAQRYVAVRVVKSGIINQTAARLSEKLRALIARAGGHQMNKPYDVIYLQWNHPIFSDERDSVCWCQDQIYDDDVEYCRITAAELRALQTRNELLTKALADLLEDVEFAQPQIEPGLIGKRQIRKAHIALEGEKSLKDHPAFGSWSGRDIDSVDYQREERHGEEQE